MNGKTLTTSVEIQMSMIYGKGKTVVPVKIPNVQQQKNSIDCGVFAIVLFTLVFFKLKTLVLVGFVLGNGENCWLSIHLIK
jgi:hypothetical protein